MRKIIYVPTMHGEGDRSPFDLPGMDETEVAKLNEDVEKLWDLTEGGVDKLQPKGMKVYSEGITVDTALEVEFVKESWADLIRQNPDALLRFLKTPTESELQFLKESGIGGRGTRFLLSLMVMGASIEVTEGDDYKKIIEAFENQPSQLEDPDEENKFLERVNSLMRLRDVDIADNVSRNLKDGEVGILILGASHNATEMLDDDIRVELIDPSLQEVIGELMEKYGHDPEITQRETLESRVGSENKG